jgi:hypothetical protein
MFPIQVHQKNYHYDYVTVVESLIPKNICETLRNRVNQIISSNLVTLVSHEGLGNDSVTDNGGKYLHHIFKGNDIRTYLPELVMIYHSILPLVSLITHTDAITSPYPQSDINIKAYPRGGGTLGEHRDTNGITVLMFLTTNKEAPLRMKIPRYHPSKGKWIENKQIFANEGSLLIMKGREILHDCEPTINEQKLSVVLNYYESHDTWRPLKFDDFVYNGVEPVKE